MDPDLKEILGKKKTEKLIKTLMDLADDVSHDSDHDWCQVGVASQSISHETNPGPFVAANTIPEKLKTPLNEAGETDGSGLTVHGELNTILMSTPSALTFMACNFPNCPTCVKKLIIFGIHCLIISVTEVNGEIIPQAFLEEKYRSRFEEGWRDLSLPLIKAAGVHLLGYDRDKNKSIVLNKGLPRPERPKFEEPVIFLDPLIDTVEIFPSKRKKQKKRAERLKRVFCPEANRKLSQYDFLGLLSKMSRDNERCAVAKIRDPKTGRNYILGAKEAIPPGLSIETYLKLDAQFKDTRYGTSVCPVTRLMVEAVKKGLSLDDSIVACNYMPHPGRQVDLVACGVDRLFLPEEAYKDIKYDPKLKSVYNKIKETKALKYKKIKPEILPEPLLAHPAPEEPENA